MKLFKKKWKIKIGICVMNIYTYHTLVHKWCIHLNIYTGIYSSCQSQDQNFQYNQTSWPSTQIRLVCRHIQRNRNYRDSLVTRLQPIVQSHRVFHSKSIFFIEFIEIRAFKTAKFEGKNKFFLKSLISIFLRMNQVIHSNHLHTFLCNYHSLIR